MALAVGDKLTHWLTIYLGDNSASVIRTWVVAAITLSPNLPATEAAMTARLWGRLKNGMGDGTFDLVTHLRQFRGGSLIDEVVTEYPNQPGGGGNDPPLPPNVAAVVSWPTNPYSPRRISRLYWPFVSTVHVSDTRLTPAAQTQLQGDASVISSSHAINTGTGLVGLQARLESKSDGSLWPLGQPKVSLELGTQRRRVRGSQRAAWGS